ncbi:MAG: helix-turn-helix domain-containing protein, partial [Vallitaleaceae bacterium]|nr:helix-turn-helix domain-containing protein [Vallitaleaceae bacterium]
LSLIPDLVLADIKMPVMDGLEFSAKLKKVLPNTRVVIFSGHDEFKYAQESVSLGVLDYILKPLGAATLTKKLLEIRLKLDQESEKKQYLIKIQDQLHQSLPLLKESFLNGLVCSPNSTLYSRARMESLDLSLQTGPFAIGIMESDLSQVNQAYIDVHQFALKNIALETLGHSHPLFIDASGRIVVIFSIASLPDHFHPREMILEILAVLQKAIILYLKMSATFGVGGNVDRIDGLFSSYNEALTALDCKYTLGKDKIYDFNDLNFMETEFFFPFEESGGLMTAIKTNNKEAITQALGTLSSLLKEKNSISVTNIKFVFIEVITGLTKLLAETKISSQQLWSKCLMLYTSVETLESIDEITRAIEPVAFEVSKSLSELWTTSNKNVVSIAMSYVQINYKNEDLSLQMVAEHASVSSGYLSAIFKKEAGVNFSSYLTRTRMEKAMELLLTTAMNVYEIAYNTGFSNPHYFSISFKKYTDLSPSEYREKAKSK